MHEAFEIRVYGKVQGVWFRHFCKKSAEDLKLNGWIQNEKDGSVSIKVVGEKLALEKFFFWCTEGSPLSAVSKIEITRVAEEPLNKFEIIKK